MQRKLSGVSTKTLTNAAHRANQRANSLKKNGSDSVDEGDITGSSGWGKTPDKHTARKVASTDTLGSDAALDLESNDSLYGDDSGKLNGEAWEIHSNLSDQ